MVRLRWVEKGKSTRLSLPLRNKNAKIFAIFESFVSELLQTRRLCIPMITATDSD